MQSGSPTRIKVSSATTVSKVIRLLPLLGIVVGVAILTYVAAQYWTMYTEQRRLEREWQAQQQTSPSHAASMINDGLTRISIPKINLSAVVVEGTTHKALLRGPGHIKDSAVPGELGNAVITGHRDTFFRHIYELGKGDVITVQRNGKSFKYEVTGKQVVEPTDVSVLKPTSDAQLTLITCYPTYYIGPAPERLVVFTKMMQEKAAMQPVSAPGPYGRSTVVTH